MKADLYVQGHYWATIQLHDDGLLSVLAQGMITRATEQAFQLQEQLKGIDGVHCCISLAFPEPIPHTPPEGD